MKFPILSFCMTCLAATSATAANQWHVYFGCYTNAQTGSKGIMVSKFNSATGTLSEPVLAAETGSPSFLALHPDGKYLYAVGEGPRTATRVGRLVLFRSISRTAP